MASGIHERLVDLADPVRAEGERAYLRTCYEHLGVPMGPGRKVVKDWYRREHAPELSIPELLRLAEETWYSFGVAFDPARAEAQVELVELAARELC